MADEVPADSLATATQATGLRRYLWLYFFVVPVAAFSASTVAIVIAALQGLEGHPDSYRLYALTVIIGLKLIAGTSGAYLLSVFLGVYSVAIFSRSLNREMERKPDNKYILAKYTWRNQMMIGTSLIYGIFGMVFFVYLYVYSDIIEAWDLILEISS